MALHVDGASSPHRRHFMTAHIDLTLEALRVRRDAYAASGGEAAVIYDKLRDELVLARQRFSDQEKELATARLDLRTAVEVPQARQDETLVQPPDHADPRFLWFSACAAARYL